MYNGKIESKTFKKKKKIDIRSFVLWYIGIVFSFLPIFFDMIVFLSDHERVTKEYWTGVCLKGDILWILATVIVLTVVDYFSDGKKKKGYKVRFAVAGIIMWGIVFGFWIVFKYVYATDFKGDWPIAITLIVAGFTLTCCTPLQVKLMEVRE